MKRGCYSGRHPVREAPSSVTSRAPLVLGAVLAIGMSACAGLWTSVTTSRVPFRRLQGLSSGRLGQTLGLHIIGSPEALRELDVAAPFDGRASGLEADFCEDGACKRGTLDFSRGCVVAFVWHATGGGQYAELTEVRRRRDAYAKTIFWLWVGQPIHDFQPGHDRPIAQRVDLYWVEANPLPDPSEVHVIGEASGNVVRHR